MIEYWTPDVLAYQDQSTSQVEIEDDDEIERASAKPAAQDKGYTNPSSKHVAWKFKSDTDLYEFRKAKTIPTSISFSPDFSKI
ncbi:hypothetical protein HDU91_002035, partial [Kappamyces sp. JEL0680]